jgi:rhamnose utilization protein RhaD (predicted bifunctional aldolase and dehydrogenase)
MAIAGELELQLLRKVTARAGNDPLLTQASTGNSSAKVNGTLWIKASGKWMADAMDDDAFISLDLDDITACLQNGRDPSTAFPRASLETAMHAVMPHRFVLHVHSVNAIAWAVRQDAVAQLQSRLDGMRWQWIPYAASGLPLARAIDAAIERHPDTDVFMLGNHGLVIGAENVETLEPLLREVRRRLSIRPRGAHPADYTMLAAACDNTHWTMPEDDELHAIATDSTSKAILRGGVLYPCQAMFPGAGTAALFQPVSRECASSDEYADRPFLPIENFGVVVNEAAGPAELELLSGVVRVLLRLSSAVPIRYLTEDEIAGLSPAVAQRYMESANSRVTARFEQELAATRI